MRGYLRLIMISMLLSASCAKLSQRSALGNGTSVESLFPVHFVVTMSQGNNVYVQSDQSNQISGSNQFNLTSPVHFDFSQTPGASHLNFMVTFDDGIETGTTFDKTFTLGGAQDVTVQVTEPGTSSTVTNTFQLVMICNNGSQPTISGVTVTPVDADGYYAYQVTGTHIAFSAWDFDGDGRPDTLYMPGATQSAYSVFIGNRTIGVSVMDACGNQAAQQFTVNIPSGTATSSYISANLSGLNGNTDPALNGSFLGMAGTSSDTNHYTFVCSKAAVVGTSGEMQIELNAIQDTYPLGQNDIHGVKQFAFTLNNFPSQNGWVGTMTESVPVTSFEYLTAPSSDVSTSAEYDLSPQQAGSVNVTITGQKLLSGPCSSSGSENDQYGLTVQGDFSGSQLVESDVNNPASLSAVGSMVCEYTTSVVSTCTPSPSCHLTTDQSTYYLGQPIVVHMTTTGQVTNGTVNGETPTNGTVTVTPGTYGGTVTINGSVSGPGGSGTCSVTVNTVNSPPPATCSISSPASDPLGTGYNVNETISGLPSGGQVTGGTVNGSPVTIGGNGNGTISEDPTSSGSVSYSGNMTYTDAQGNVHTISCSGSSTNVVGPSCSVSSPSSYQTGGNGYNVVETPSGLPTGSQITGGTVNGSPVNIANGDGTINQNPTSAGTVQYQGTLTYTDPQGVSHTLTCSSSSTHVSSPAAASCTASVAQLSIYPDGTETINITPTNATGGTVTLVGADGSTIGTYNVPPWTISVPASSLPGFGLVTVNVNVTGANGNGTCTTQFDYVNPQ